jgi:hypothetical protein
MRPNELEVTNCVVALNSRGGEVGVIHQMTLISRDAFDNPLTGGGHVFRARLTMASPFDESGSGDSPLYASSSSVATGAPDPYYHRGLYTFASDGKQVQAELLFEDEGNGRYTISYVTQKSGEALLRIFKTVVLSGTTLEQSICTSTSGKAHCLRSSRLNPLGTLLLTFTSSQPTSDESVVYSTGTTLEKSTAGMDATFYISAHDRFRNVQSQDGFLFTVLLTHQLTGRRLLTKSEYTRDGKYLGTYNAKLSGAYTLAVRRGGDDLLMEYDSEIVQGPIGLFTPPLVVYPGASTGETTVVTHPYDLAGNLPVIGNTYADDRNVFVATAGVEGRFTITAYDMYGNQRLSGGEQFVIQMGFFDEGTYIDNNDGTYTGIYMQTLSGVYGLSIFVNQQLVSSSVPDSIYDTDRQYYPVLIKGANTSALSCFATGAGLYFAEAGETSWFFVKSADRFGNVKIDGGDTFNASVTGLDPVELDWVDMKTGTYKYNYTETRAGVYTVDVAYDDILFYSSPSGRKLALNPSSISLNSMASGSGLTKNFEHFQVNKVHYIEIQLRDRFGNNITQGDISSFKVVIRTGTGSRANFVRSESEAGVVEGKFPDPVADPSYYAEFEINNPYLLLPSIIYTAEYTTPTAGWHSISIMYFGKHLTGSPYLVRVEPGPTGAGEHCLGWKCTYVEGPALLRSIQSPSEDLVDVQQRLTIQARDVYGNNKLTGGDEFLVEVTRPSGVKYNNVPSIVNGRRAIHVTDNADGTYHVNFTYVQLGVNQLGVSLARRSDGEACEGDCFAVNTPRELEVVRVTAWEIKPVYGHSSYVYGDALDASVVGELSPFHIVARAPAYQSDFGLLYNVTDVIGGDDFEVVMELDPAYTAAHVGRTVDGAATLVPIPTNVTDWMTGSYTVTYNTTVAGLYRLRVSLQGQSVARSQSDTPWDDSLMPPLSSDDAPHYVRVYADKADAVMSTVNGIPFEKPVVSGDVATFNIIARDRFGNLLEYKPFEIMPDTFEVYLEPQFQMRAVDQTVVDKTITLSDHYNGTITVSFNMFKSGLYLIVVELKAEALTGCPVYQEAQAGNINAEYMTLAGPNGEHINEVISNAFALEEFTFDIQGVDRYRNRLLRGGDAGLIYMEMVRTRTGVKTVGRVTDNSDGTYTARFVLPRTGEYTLLVEVNNAPVLERGTDVVSGKGIITDVASYGPYCYTIGSAVNANDAGVQGTFFIQAVDRNDMVKRCGNDVFAVNVYPWPSVTNEYGRQLPELQLAPVDMSRLVAAGGVPGQYRVDYLIHEFGAFNVSITLGGRHIKGSPFPLKVAKKLPPIPSNGYFSSTATKITIYFNAVTGERFSTNRAGQVGHHACDAEFSAATVAMLGEGAYCSWPTDSALDIYLGYAATVVPNDLLILKRGVIYSVFENSDSASGSVIVTRPASSPEPVVRTQSHRSEVVDQGSSEVDWGTLGLAMKMPG